LFVLKNGILVGEKEFKMNLKKDLSKKIFSKKSSKALNGASWMFKTEAKVVFTAVATALTHKLLQKAAHKYPKLRFLEQGS
jgi:hypothetical protein